MPSAPSRPTSERKLSAARPAIQVTTWDYRRLSAMVDAFRLRGCDEVVDLLSQELERAELVDPTAIRRDVVTMHSRVKFIDEDRGEVRTVTLVYPGEEDSRRGKVAVITPVGSVLLGLRVGSEMAWHTLDGRTKRLSILEVSYQPEANGLDGACHKPAPESAPVVQGG
jgi:regulator of nucleoside diphosphate kinase